MLLARAFTQVFTKWNNGNFQFLGGELLFEKMAIVLTQLLHRVLTNQHKNGSWADSSCGITAYAVLILTAISPLPWAAPLGSQISKALEHSRIFLDCVPFRWTKPTYTWIAKVSYCIPLLSRMYCLAALHAIRSHFSIEWSTKIREKFGGKMSASNGKNVGLHL